MRQLETRTLCFGVQVLHLQLQLSIATVTDSDSFDEYTFLLFFLLKFTQETMAQQFLRLELYLHFFHFLLSHTYLTLHVGVNAISKLVRISSAKNILMISCPARAGVKATRTRTTNCALVSHFFPKWLLVRLVDFFAHTVGQIFCSIPMNTAKI